MPTTATALIVIDVQEGFGREDFWGQPANLDVESSIAALVEHWRTRRPGPLVIVRHDSANPASPLHPGDPGNRLRPFLAAIQPDLLITKKVNSAFYGEPDLDGRLRAAEINDLVICGVQTNMCVETTARMAGNLGYRVQGFRPDGCHSPQSSAGVFREGDLHRGDSLGRRPLTLRRASPAAG